MRSHKDTVTEYVNEVFPNFADESNIPDSLLEFKDILLHASASTDMEQIKQFIIREAAPNAAKPKNYNGSLVRLLATELVDDLWPIPLEPSCRNSINVIRASYLFVIAAALKRNSKFNAASELASKAVQLLETITNKNNYILRTLARAYALMAAALTANVHAPLRKNDLLSALDYTRAVENKIASDYFLETNYLVELSNIALEANAYPEAIEHYQSAINCLEATEMSGADQGKKINFIMTTYRDMASLAMQKEEHADAASYAVKGLASAPATTNPAAHALLNRYAAQAYFHLGQLPEAKKCIMVSYKFHSKSAYPSRDPGIVAELQIDFAWQQQIESGLEAIQRKNMRAAKLTAKLIDQHGLFSPESNQNDRGMKRILEHEPQTLTNS